MMKRKLFALFTALTLCAALLAGCGGSSSAGTASSAPASLTETRPLYVPLRVPETGSPAPPVRRAYPTFVLIAAPHLGQNFALASSLFPQRGQNEGAAWVACPSCAGAWWAGED